MQLIQVAKNAVVTINVDPSNGNVQPFEGWRMIVQERRLSRVECPEQVVVGDNRQTRCFQGRGYDSCSGEHVCHAGSGERRPMRYMPRSNRPGLPYCPGKRSFGLPSEVR